MDYWGMVARNIHSVAFVMVPMSTMLCWLIVMFYSIVLQEAERKALRPFRWALLIPPLSTLAYVLTPAW